MITALEGVPGADRSGRIVQSGSCRDGRSPNHQSDAPRICQEVPVNDALGLHRVGRRKCWLIGAVPARREPQPADSDTGRAPDADPYLSAAASKSCPRSAESGCGASAITGDTDLTRMVPGGPAQVRHGSVPSRRIGVPITGRPLRPAGLKGWHDFLRDVKSVRGERLWVKAAGVRMVSRLRAELGHYLGRARDRPRPDSPG